MLELSNLITRLFSRYGSLGRKETMGRYRKQQQAVAGQHHGHHHRSSSSTGLSVASSPKNYAAAAAYSNPSDNFEYANASVINSVRSPIMGRKALQQQQQQQLPSPMLPQQRHFEPVTSIEQILMQQQQQQELQQYPNPKTLDRRQLERNLETLIAERGVNAIGQLTKEMSPAQIQALLQLTSVKLNPATPEVGRSRRPLDLSSLDDSKLENILSELSVVREDPHRRRDPRDPRDSRDSREPRDPRNPRDPRDPRRRRRDSTSDDEMVDPVDRQRQHPQRRSSRLDAQQLHHQQQPHLHHHQNAELQKSSKNLSVHFDPSQVRPSPPEDQRRLHHQAMLSPEVYRRSKHHSSTRNYDHQQQQNQQMPLRYGSLPRSNSYSGRLHQQQQQHPPQEEQFDGGRRGGSGRHQFRVARPAGAEEYNDDYSSSSSDSDDDPYAYQLPQRKAYGGVRVSYVPNDRRAVQKQHRRNRSDLQLDSIQHQQHRHQQQQQQQHQQRNHHQYQQQQHMIPDHQRGQQPQPQSLPAGSGIGQTRQLSTGSASAALAASDKDKCIIS